MDTTQLAKENYDLIRGVSKGRLDVVKEILEKYNSLPEIQKQIINYQYDGANPYMKDRAGKLLHIVTDLIYKPEMIPIMEYLIEKGAVINYVIEINGIKKTAVINAIENGGNLQAVKLLVDNGGSLSMPPESSFSLLHFVKKIDTLKYLIEKGVPIDVINNDFGYTPLNIHTRTEKPTEFLNELLKAGANPNTVTARGETPLDTLLNPAYKPEKNLEKIKLFISYGAKITPSIQKKVDEDLLAPEIIKALNATKTPPIPWKGWTKSDATALDEVFNNPYNFSACPVCLKYTSREDGCMYMSHVCTELGGLYNKKLYKMYKSDEGKIYWCTLCNRICMGHRHYKVSLPETKAELGEGGDFFTTDCRPIGGGFPEKVQRFRRLREYALDLNDTELNEQAAFDELTEEFWKAPLRREKKLINTLVAKKAWQNTNKFPENRRPNNTNEANAPNIPSPPTLEMPTRLEKGYNSIGMNDDVPVLHFHHETTGGINHNDSLIGVTTLQNTLVEKLKNFGTEDFGFCIQYPECKARLFPEEIKPHVPDELYKDYKKKFNAKFKNRSGGAINFFGEATDAECLIKKGGRKTRRKSSKKSKKSRRRFPLKK